MPDDNPVTEPLPPALLDASSFAVAHLPLSLQVFFNDDLFKRCQTVANYLAKAAGCAPRHLLGNPEACFAIVSRALTWRLDPYAVAQATYQTPNGQIGYFGSLCQAIMENSGRLVGGVRFEHFGDWSKLRAKFKIVTSDKGGKYPVATWLPEDEIGLGVMVRAQLRDEAEPREFRFDLEQAFPRNSTLWATDPRTQICYTAVRRFGSATVPALMMGVPFDREELSEWAETLKDVTPRPELREFQPDPPTEPEPPPERRRTRRAPSQPAAAEPPDAGLPDSAATVFEFADEVGEVVRFAEANEAIAAYADLLDNAKPEHLDALIENGTPLLTALAEAGRQKEAAMIAKLQADRRRELAGAPDAGPANAAAAAPDPLHVPLGASVQQWFQPARAKLRELDARNAPADEFRHFREVNQPALDRLKSEFRSWHTILDKILTTGESRMPV